MNIQYINSKLDLVLTSIKENIVGVPPISKQTEKIVALAIVAFGVMAMLFYTLYSKWTRGKAIALKNEGESLYGEGKYQEASQVFQKALKYDSNNPALLKRYGEMLIENANHWEAKKQFEKVLEKKPNDVEALRGYAKTCVGENAVIAFEKALAIDPKDVQNLEGYGNALCDVRRYEEALTQYKKAVEIDPKQVLLLKGFGKILRHCAVDMKEKNIFEALELYNKALEINPEDASTLFCYAEILQSQRKNAEADLNYKKALEIEPRNILYLNHYLDFLYYQGRDAEAKEQEDKIKEIKNAENLKKEVAAKAAVEANPTDANASQEYGKVLFDQHKYGEALEQYENALNNDKNGVISVFTLKGGSYQAALFCHARNLQLEGKLEEAAKHYEKGIKWLPNEWNVLGSYAEILRKQEKYEKAALFYTRALSNIPINNTRAMRICLAGYGEALSAQGKYKDAIEQFNKIQPASSLLALRGYGEALYLQGNYGEAAVKFKEYLATKADSEIAIHYAAALAKEGNIDEAQGQLDKILALNDPELTEEVSGYLSALNDTGTFEVKKLTFLQLPF